jgi:hypothetical protein
VVDIDLVKKGVFQIKIRVGNLEIEVSAPDEQFVLRETAHLIEQLKLNEVKSSSNGVELRQESLNDQTDRFTPRPAKGQTLNEFFRQFKFQTNLEKTLVLGYWCEIRQGQHFTPEDILARYKEVKEPTPANIRRDLSKLVGKGLLLSSKSQDGLQAFELTNSGIREVESKLSQE